jgi:hypothetical protein
VFALFKPGDVSLPSGFHGFLYQPEVRLEETERKMAETALALSRSSV